MDIDSPVLKKLEIPPEFLEKFRPRARKKGEPRSEREELLGVFLAKLNAQRIADGFPKLTYGRLARVLQHVPTEDLYAFYRQCDAARHFGKFFWWSLKPKEA
jgi:hypothetical protein